MNPLVAYFKSLGNISAEAEFELEKNTKHFEKKKYDHFLKAGQTHSSIFVMDKGLVRAYFHNGKKEITTWFGKEHEPIGSLAPLYTQTASFENIQFLEDASIYAITIEKLQALYIRYPELNWVGRKIAEYLCMLLEERINILHTGSAEERYKAILNDYPYLLQRVNLGYIASYLGISQETLSRIRSNR